MVNVCCFSTCVGSAPFLRNPLERNVDTCSRVHQTLYSWENKKLSRTLHVECLTITIRRVHSTEFSVSGSVL